MQFPYSCVSGTMVLVPATMTAISDIHIPHDSSDLYTVVYLFVLSAPFLYVSIFTMWYIQGKNRIVRGSLSDRLGSLMGRRYFTSTGREYCRVVYPGYGALLATGTNTGAYPMYSRRVSLGLGVGFEW